MPTVRDMPSLTLTFRRGLIPLPLSRALVAFALLSACGEAEEGPDPFDDASLQPIYADGSVPVDSGYPSYDSGFPRFDAGNPSDASATSDSAPVSDASRSGDASATNDAGGIGGLGDLGGLGGLFGGGDAGAVADAGGNTGNPGKGELDPNGAINPNLPPKADNPKECPSLAPPNPVGSCLGLPIYVGCGYGKAGGPQLSCTCDWYHWLCI